MSKAAELAARLQKVDVAAGLGLIEESSESALHFQVIGEAMCIMHDDGSVNIVEPSANGPVTVEVIAAENVLRVLAHYRPFEGVFPRGMH